MNRKTYMAKTVEQKPDCYLIDAKDKILGRIAAKAATILRGKHKVTFTPHIDTGDLVVIINAKDVKVSGKKLTDKLYQKYTGFHGGQSDTSFEKLMAKAPTQPLILAINSMIPNNPMGYKQRTKLRVYEGSEHPHASQKPIPVEIH